MASTEIQRLTHFTFIAGLILVLLVIVFSLPTGSTNAAELAQIAPPLGAAGSFAVLGGSTVTNTGTTSVDGDLGVWPGTSVTGFPPGTVTGTIYNGDAVAQNAQAAAQTAYDNLTGQACNTDLTGQDLGGLTLLPGVYCFSSSAQLTGTLILDAQNDENSVFIFQIGSTLTTASNSSVSIINNGNLCNVFWRVGSSATIGTSTTLLGNVIADQSITLNTGATLSGRAIALNGAVTMDTNLITMAVCAAQPPSTLTPTSTTTSTSTPTTTSTSTPTTTSTSIFTSTLTQTLTLTTIPNTATTQTSTLTTAPNTETTQTSTLTTVPNLTITPTSVLTTASTTPEPYLLPNTGGNMSGTQPPGTQLMQIGLRFLGIGLVLFWLLLIRKKRKLEK